MKLIKRGNRNLPDQKFRGTCQSCGSEFEAIRSELHNISPGNQREPGEFAWEKCTECGAGGRGIGGVLFYPVKDGRRDTY